MPASQKVKYQQFEIFARPAWWVRRWTRFPLFFQAFRLSFEVIIEKVSEPKYELGHQSDINTLQFYVEFSDKSTVDFSVDVSELKVGDIINKTTERILLAPTGDARICLDVGTIYGKKHFQTLYAFVVSAEATLIFLLLNVVLGAIFALLLRP